MDIKSTQKASTGVGVRMNVSLDFMVFGEGDSREIYFMQKYLFEEKELGLFSLSFKKIT